MAIRNYLVQASLENDSIDTVGYVNTDVNMQYKNVAQFVGSSGIYWSDIPILNYVEASVYKYSYGLEITFLFREIPGQDIYSIICYGDDFHTYHSEFIAYDNKNKKLIRATFIGSYREDHFDVILKPNTWHHLIYSSIGYNCGWWMCGSSFIYIDGTKSAIWPRRDAQYPSGYLQLGELQKPVSLDLANEAVGLVGDMKNLNMWMGDITDIEAETKFQAADIPTTFYCYSAASTSCVGNYTPPILGQ
ncbi:MAG: hypothetical protein U9O94_08760, partial [Nanoarchaeota archaeon]|nr:hypothetical protein [Nanoarchaeota archaeon]